MARQHAWEIDDKHDGIDVVPAYDEMVDLVGSLLDTINRLGGQVTVAAKRQDTGTKIVGTKVFETVGFVVVFQDHVPGVSAAPPPPAPADAPAPPADDPGLAPDIEVDEEGE